MTSRRAVLLLSPLFACCFDPATDRSGLEAEPGLVGPCYTYGGPAETAGVGQCRLGFEVNFEDEAGEIRSECLGEVHPALEVCNGLDDDCDGATDNQGACATDVLDVLASSGAKPFTVTAPDRVGPALLKHHFDGQLSSCEGGVTPKTCVARFLDQVAPAWGSDEEGGTWFELEEPPGSGDRVHLRYGQRFGALRVEGASMVIHADFGGGEWRIRSVTANAKAVRADLVIPEIPPVSADRALEIAGGTGEPELVVHPDCVPVELPGDERAAEAGAEPRSEPGTTGGDLLKGERARLAWRVRTNTGTAWVNALVDEGEPCAEAPGHAFATVSATSLDPSGGSKVEDDLDGNCAQSSVAQATYQAAAAATCFHAFVVDAKLGPPDTGKKYWEKNLEVIVQDPGGLCSAGSGPLGWIAVEEPTVAHVCKIAAPGGVLSGLSLKSIAETTRHELIHGLLFDAGGLEPDDGFGEDEATNEGVAMALAEMAECHSGGTDACAFVHQGGDLKKKVDPGASCKSSSIKVAGIPPGTSLSLCPSGEAAKKNRLVVGHALYRAACEMGRTCRPGECDPLTGLPTPECGSVKARKDAHRRLLRVVEEAWRHYLTGLTIHGDLYVGLVQACGGLAAAKGGGDDQVTCDDCAAIQLGFSQAGLAAECDQTTCEVCDGKDNDCDGFADNAPGSNDDFTLLRACPEFPPKDFSDAVSGVGICEAGTQVCGGIKGYGACSGKALPEVETCNGIDDDCDGLVDDDGGVTDGLLSPYKFDADGDGSGAGPVQHFCYDAEPKGFVFHPPGAEDDCDDENPLRHPGAVEVCNALDDDCDGDPDPECACQPNQPSRWCGPVEVACFDMPVSDPMCKFPAAVGNPETCKVGQRHCLFDGDDLEEPWKWTVCSGDAKGQEVCNGLDDDCDGQADEDITGLAAVCSNEAGFGQEICSDGVVVCEILQPYNACGGPSALPAEPGDDCGASGKWVCIGTQDIACVDQALGSLPVPALVAPTFIPPKTNGDWEFDGGVYITATAKLFLSGPHVKATISMEALENKGDDTTAKGTKTYILLSLAEGCEAKEGTFDKAESGISYVDQDLDEDGEPWEDDVFEVIDQPGPVQTWRFVGDTSGDEAGIYTGVTVTFKPFVLDYACGP